MAEVRITPAQAECVRRILRTHLPEEARVTVFGSRATGRGLKPHSDLDLLIESPEAVPLAVMADLRDALTESDLPFSVDLVERRDASDEFLASIARSGLVEFQLLPSSVRSG